MGILSTDKGPVLLFPEMRKAFTAYNGLKVFFILRYYKRSIYKALCVVAFTFTFPPQLRHISCGGFAKTLSFFV